MPFRRGAVSVLALWAGTAHAETISLDDVVRRALAAHPDLKVAEAEASAAAGEVRRARTYSFNPELIAEQGHQEPAQLPGNTGRATALSFGQTIELGKRGARTAAAESRLAAAEARVEFARHTVRSGARRAFLVAMAARDRVRTAREGETVAEELRAFASERLQLGAGTQLQYNVAAAAAGRARGERLSAQRRYRETLAGLATAIAAAPGELPEPDGESGPLPEVPLTVEDLVSRALAQRGDLRAARQERLAAESDIRVARSLGIPDPALAIRVDRNPDDRAVLFGVSVPLPFFNRNQGGIAVARALKDRADVVEQAAARAVERDVRTAYAAYALAREAALGFDREVIDRLGENLELARESFRAGKISLLEFNLVRRDLVETRLAYLDALAEMAEARFALELAAGGSVE